MEKAINLDDVKRSRVLRVIACCILTVGLLFAVFNTFIAHADGQFGLFAFIIVLSSLVLATVVFVWADVLSDQIAIKPRHLRIVGSCVITFAVLFAGCMTGFDMFIARFQPGVKCSFVIIILLNLAQGSVLLMWANVKDLNVRPNF